MAGEIPHKDTFSSREISAIPKFVRKKMESAAAKLRAELDDWPYSFFTDVTDLRKNK